MPVIQIDTSATLRGAAPFGKAVRAILQDRLTDVQYRRVALLYGFDDEPLSERAAAAVEGCGRPRIQRSREAALRKLRENAELWLLWLLASEYVDGRTSDDGEGADPYQRDIEGLMGRRTVGPIAYARSRAVDPAFSGNKGWPRTRQRGRDDWPQYDGTPGVSDPHEDMHTVDLNPGSDGWESDAYNPAPDEMEVYADGWIACHEYVSREDNPYAVQNRRGKRANPERRAWADRMEQAWRRGWLDARKKVRSAA